MLRASLNSPRDVATHLGHRGLIFRAPMSACKGVWAWVSRPVWARSSVVEAQGRVEVSGQAADLGHEAPGERRPPALFEDRPPLALDSPVGRRLPRPDERLAGTERLDRPAELGRAELAPDGVHPSTAKQAQRLSRRALAYAQPRSRLLGMPRAAKFIVLADNDAIGPGVTTDERGRLRVLIVATSWRHRVHLVQRWAV